MIIGKIHEDALETISNSKSITELSLNIQNNYFDLSPITKMKNLKILDLSGCNVQGIEKNKDKFKKGRVSPFLFN